MSSSQFPTITGALEIFNFDNFKNDAIFPLGPIP
jgi:hypothetical protein